ncbi:MAG: acetolactate synthase, partial [Oscillospiraceae bacterium]
EKIADAGIDIRALSIADTTDFGILRLIVDKPEAAEQTLKDKGLTLSLTEVIAVQIDDKPGGFARAIRILTDAGIDVEYMYAFVCRREGHACVIIRVEDNGRAIEVLKNSGVEMLTQQEIFNM